MEHYKTEEGRRGHIWRLKEDSGKVDDFAYSHELHNGPSCVKCDYSFCEHCRSGPSVDCTNTIVKYTKMCKFCGSEDIHSVRKEVEIKCPDCGGKLQVVRFESSPESFEGICENNIRNFHDDFCNFRAQSADTFNEAWDNLKEELKSRDD